jgi:hypothetical protein
VTLADTLAGSAKPMVAAKFAAAIGCAFDVDVDVDVDVDFDFDPMLAPRALSDGASGAPLNSAHSAWEEYPVKFGAQRLGRDL